MASRKRRRKSKLQNLHFGTLENRQLLAGITFDPATGIATVDGSNLNDQVQLVEDGPKVKIIFHGHSSSEFDSTELNEVVFVGRDGNDWFKNNTSVPSRAYGQKGDDVLLGGRSADRVIGGEGNDRLFGNGGNDYVSGDQGQDILRGNGGENQLRGGEGDDHIIGGNLRDQIFGEAGNDILYGLGGDDFISGGDDSDTIIGNAGNDQLNGDDGNDRIWGGEDHDKIRGGRGNDRAAGNDGDDEIWGDDGADRLQGNSGRDRLQGNRGDDSLSGGDDDDWIVGNEGRNSLLGGSGNDFLLGSDSPDFLNGEDGHDRIYGGSGSDILRGGSGRDKLFGQDGNDRLDGESGNDDLVGGRHADRISGGQGNDDYSSDDSDSVYFDDDDFRANDDFEIRGTISNLDTTTQTFEVLGVPVNYSVAYLQTAVADGAFVKVEGAYDGTELLAKEVESERNDDRSENFEARGTITNLDTNAKTFQFLGFNVDYSSARVEGTVAESATIELEGRLDGNGNVTAHRLETSDNGDNGGDDNNDGGDDNGGNNQEDGTLELRGNIANLNTNAKTFTLLGITVDYSSAQVQGTLTEGAFFKADGIYNGALTAREVEAETPDDDRDENVEAYGQVSNLDTQNQTFEVLGFVVDYSGAEIEDSFDNGTSIKVEGWLANGTIRAEEIQR